MDPEVAVKVELLPIAPGEHVVLEDIRFVGNDSKPLRSSGGRPAAAALHAGEPQGEVLVEAM